MVSLVEVLAFVQTAPVREVLDIQRQCLERMEGPGFTESPGRKRLRGGAVSRPVTFLKLQGVAIGKALAMLCLKEAVSLRQCNSEMCSWWHPSTQFMLAFLQCSPIGCLLRPYLAAHGSMSIPTAIQEICAWSRRSILPFDALAPVTRFSNGLTLEEAQRDHEEQVLMTAGTHTTSLSSRWCSVMAQVLMQGPDFACPDPVRKSIQSLAESMPSVLAWLACDFTTGSSKLEVKNDEGHGVGYNHEEQFKVVMTTADGTVEITLEIWYLTLDEHQGDEASKLSCTGIVHGKRMNFFHYNSEDRHDRRISGDLIAVNVLGSALLGREVNPAILLHVLWRLLCAPMMVWPHWTPNGCESCEFSRVAAELETGEEPQCTPSLLRARNLFEMVASHTSVQEDGITPERIRDLGLVSVSKSCFDEENMLHQLSAHLTAL